LRNCIASKHHTTHRILSAACACALAVTFTASLPHPARASQISVPPLPSSLEVLPPNHPFLLGRAKGTQNYICLPSGFDAAGNPTSFAWKLFTPEATLFKGDPGNPKQLITHFFSPNPDESNTDPLTDFHPIRATWQDSNDTSAVWARTVVAGDSVAVTPGAIAWLKLTVVGVQFGPTGGAALTQTTFVQRVNTVGGAAPPANTCESLPDVGKQAFRPYTADYIFYRKQ